MSPRERAAFKALPAAVKCFRGGERSDVMKGVSWSLSRVVAERFARLAVKEPVLVSATVEKSGAFAVKLDRAEAELVVLPDRVHVDAIEALNS
jgi:hypothetical protein